MNLSYIELFQKITYKISESQHRSDSSQVKRNLISSITNLVQELPHGLPNHLRLRTLGNQKVFEKSLIWQQTQTTAQSPFQKLNFHDSSKKVRKNRQQIFLALSGVTGFFYFVPNILYGIVSSVLQLQFFYISQTCKAFCLPLIKISDNSVALKF